MILVVGATGEVGFEVVRDLRERGEDVVALVRPTTDDADVAATGARVVRGDLSDSDALRTACEGVDTVVATASTIVPRKGERADFDALERGYAELGRIARAAGVRRMLFVSVPPEFAGQGAPEFDAKAEIEKTLQAEGPPLTVVRPSLFMECWLPALGSRLPLKGAERATLQRGHWLPKMMGALAGKTLDRFGLAQVPGNGAAQHAFIAADDVAGSLAAAAASSNGLPDELRLGGPEVLSWRDVAGTYSDVLSRRVRSVPQPAAPLRAFAAATRRLSPAVSNLLALQALVATVPSTYEPDDARRLLGREPTSVEAFLRERATEE